MLPTRFRAVSTAFTLVEIMVVVVVIGLLAALAIPQFQKIRTRSQDSAIVGNARQLASAAAQYFLESGSTMVLSEHLIGSDKYIKNWATIANETYPVTISAGSALTISGIAGARTITYSP